MFYSYNQEYFIFLWRNETTDSQIVQKREKQTD